MDCRVCKFVRKHAITFIVGFVGAIICFVILENVMKPFSTSKYCGSCHEMDTAYKTWEVSSHGANRYGFRVECVDCHLPSKDNYFKYMAKKTYTGLKDAYIHYFGDEYNLEDVRGKVIANFPNSNCMKCHKELLASPESSDALAAHKEFLNQPGDSKMKCVTCHSDLHKRAPEMFFTD